MPDTATQPGPAACLTALAAGRDPVAWAGLLAGLGERIRRCCARHAGPVLADDAVQETLLHLRDDAGSFRVPPGGDPDTAARSWVLAVAAHSALQVLRRERRLQHREHLVAAEAALHHDPDPAASLMAEESAEELRRALSSLPPAMRSAVALRHIEGLGCAEIAAALDCPEGTAKALVHRGLERLRRLLGGRGTALGLAGLASLLANLPAAEGAGAAGLAAGPALLTATRQADTTALPQRPPHPARLLRPALWLGVAACLCLACLLPLATGQVAQPPDPPAEQPRMPAEDPAATAATAAAADEAEFNRLMAVHGLPALPPHGGAGASARISSDLFDEHGRSTSYSLEQRPGGPVMEVRRAGALLWRGPVGSEAERALVPEEFILGAAGLGLDFEVKVQEHPGELQLRTGGQDAVPASPQ